jgi:hypothetical protein
MCRCPLYFVLLQLTPFKFRTQKVSTASSNRDEEQGNSCPEISEKGPPKFLDGFDFISDGAWQQRATHDLRGLVDSASSSTVTLSPYSVSPSVILLFSWTGALPKHVEKYTTGYSKLFPSSSIITISTTLPDLIFRTSSSKQAQLTTLVETVSAQIDSEGVIVHCFSDGGSNKAVEFAEAYFHHTGKRLQCQALFLDSTPGHPRYLNYCAAFQKSLPPNPIFHFLGLLIGYLVLAIFWVVYNIFVGKKNNVITRTRERLEDNRFWDPEIPRCYLYSEADKLIWWQDIEEHGIQASRSGTTVTLVRFQGSMHCAHIRENEDEYWNAVTDTWELRNAKSRVSHPGECSE